MAATSVPQMVSASDDEVTIESLSEKIDDLNIAMSKIPSGIDGLAKKLDDVMQLVRQVHDHSVAAPASSSYAPGPIGQQTIAPIPNVTKFVHPSTYEVTIRSFKQSNGAWVVNMAPLLQTLMQLASLEPTFHGSMRAVVDIVLTSMVGFQNGIRPLNWEAFIKDPNPANAMNVGFIQNQEVALTNIFSQLTDPNFDMHDATKKAMVAAIQKSLSKLISGINLPQFAGVKENLAFLFQPINSDPNTLYSTATQRNVTKVSLPQTYLGLAWNIRLPEATRAKVPFGDYSAFLSKPVPRIKFAAIQARPQAAQMPIGQPITGIPSLVGGTPVQPGSSLTGNAV